MEQKTEERETCTIPMSRILPEEISALLDDELSEQRAGEVRAAVSNDPVLKAQYEALLKLHGDLDAMAGEAQFQVELDLEAPIWAAASKDSAAPTTMPAPLPEYVHATKQQVRTPHTMTDSPIKWPQVLLAVVAILIVRFLPKLLPLLTGFILQLVVMLPVVWLVVRLLATPEQQPQAARPTTH